MEWKEASDSHVEGPGREEERVSAGLGAVLRERLEVEELPDGHAPHPNTHVSSTRSSKAC